MEYVSAMVIAKRWGISERMVRNYCKQGRVQGAFLVGKTWNIPQDAIKPFAKKSVKQTANNLLNILLDQKQSGYKGGIYHKVQIELTYTSNHIEGSTLTQEQTRYIFETNTIGLNEQSVKVDDIIETTNHFRCVDYIIQNALKPLNQKMLKHLHFMLKSGTTDSTKEWFRVGEYKKLPNEVGGEQTTPPKYVSKAIEQLLQNYNQSNSHSLEQIIDFHQALEKIHPFQDGNGRVGRLIIFKECLKNNIVPFVIDTQHKVFYYRGLKEWKNERGYLMDTCLSCQDQFKKWLEYFEIPY